LLPTNAKAPMILVRCSDMSFSGEYRKWVDVLLTYAMVSERDRSGAAVMTNDAASGGLSMGLLIRLDKQLRGTRRTISIL
jgi:hypothetical protein